MKTITQHYRRFFKEDSRNSMKQEITRYFKSQMPEEVKEALANASWNLHYGPSGEGMGWESALEILRNWAEEHISEIWYDQMAGNIDTSEPQGYQDETGEWIEPLGEDYRYFNDREVKRIVFGEVAEYL